jgi:hypothetical protein
VGAGARLAATVHKGRNARAGRRSSAGAASQRTTGSGKGTLRRCLNAWTFQQDLGRESATCATCTSGAPRPSRPLSRCRRTKLLEHPLVRAHTAEAMIDDLLFKVVRSKGTDEVLARAVNLLIARGAHREAARIYPRT